MQRKTNRKLLAQYHLLLRGNRIIPNPNNRIRQRNFYFFYSTPNAAKWRNGLSFSPRFFFSSSSSPSFCCCCRLIKHVLWNTLNLFDNFYNWIFWYFFFSSFCSLYLFWILLFLRFFRYSLFLLLLLSIVRSFCLWPFKWATKLHECLCIDVVCQAKRTRKKRGAHRFGL